MNCRHCQHWNPEDEQRCRLCGRRLHSNGNDTTSEWALNAVMGNLAAAPERTRASRDGTASNPAPQRGLFPERPVSNVIPFEVGTGGARVGVRAESVPAAEVPRATPAPKAAPRTAARTAASAAAAKAATAARRVQARKTVDQPELDFLPASVAPRTLRTSVQAVIYCEAPVATLTHRSLACAADCAMILIGYGMCLTSYALTGGEFPVNRVGYITFAGAFLALAIFYGLLWTLAKTETPGMRWANLRLTNFDGFAPDPGQRVRRYFATMLSFACGFGLLWALVDEESLTWQDHISKTFPTFYRPE